MRLLCALFLAAVMVVTGSVAEATFVAAKSVITLTGIGSAPACPSGFTEIVAQTSGGTFAPVTAVTTTSVVPVTAITTATVNAPTTTSRSNELTDTVGEKYRTMNTTNTLGAVTVASGGTTTSYTVANGGTATTYTYYYRVCREN